MVLILYYFVVGTCSVGHPCCRFGRLSVGRKLPASVVSLCSSGGNSL